MGLPTGNAHSATAPHQDILAFRNTVRPMTESRDRAGLEWPEESMDGPRFATLRTPPARSSRSMPSALRQRRAMSFPVQFL